jgi:hypothetical protein
MGVFMADLTLVEFSGIPERELKRILKAEVCKMFGPASPRTQNSVPARPTLRCGFSLFAWLKSILHRPIRLFY